MNPVTPARFSGLLTITAFVFAVFAAVMPAAGQGLVEYSVEFMPLPGGFHASTARGIADGDWDRPIIVGTLENAPCRAACWIPAPQGWTAHILPGLDAAMDSRANGVTEAPPGLGDWVLAVGMSVNGSAMQVPAAWRIKPSQNPVLIPLPVLNAGTGEAWAIFRPDGTPVRALVCGYADEMPPVSVVDAPQMGLSVPMIWEVSETGERLLRPAFGAGLSGHVNDIGSSGMDGFMAVGGGQSPAGGWMPQMWLSGDNGETWQNDALPLPMNMVTAEACGFDYDAAGNIVRLAGWSQSAAGMTFPIVWEREAGNPLLPWTIHELPLPAGETAAGQSGSVRKRPGRVKYSNITVSAGAAQMTLWVDDGNGWVALGPGDYLVDPQIGTPISPGALNGKFDAVATTMTAAGPGGFSASPAATDTLAAILTSTSLTGVENRVPGLISVAASPNPFQIELRIGYVLPRSGRATVTIHDVRGALVKKIEVGDVQAGEEREIRWNGTMRNGRRAASGVYFVRVATTYDVATVRVVRIE